VYYLRFQEQNGNPGKPIARTNSTRKEAARTATTRRLAPRERGDHDQEIPNRHICAERIRLSSRGSTFQAASSFRVADHSSGMVGIRCTSTNNTSGLGQPLKLGSKIWGVTQVESYYMTPRPSLVAFVYSVALILALSASSRPVPGCLSDGQ
jgi:hypothetical protein